MPSAATPFKHNQRTLANKQLNKQYALPNTIVEHLATLNIIRND